MFDKSSCYCGKSVDIRTVVLTLASSHNVVKYAGFVTKQEKFP
jgi:hypothetical protein